VTESFWATVRPDFAANVARGRVAAFEAARREWRGGPIRQGSAQRLEQLLIAVTPFDDVSLDTESSSPSIPFQEQRGLQVGECAEKAGFVQAVKHEAAGEVRCQPLCGRTWASRELALGHSDYLIDAIHAFVPRSQLVRRSTSHVLLLRLRARDTFSGVIGRLVIRTPNASSPALARSRV
jgi:hypothetical protein